MNRYLAATFAGIAAIVGMTNAQAATTPHSSVARCRRTAAAALGYDR